MLQTFPQSVLFILLMLGATVRTAGAADATRVFAEAVVDPRVATVRTLHQGNGFRPMSSVTDWKARAAYLRTQVLISAGLWPLPKRCPLNAVAHSPIDKGDYTIEKVYFQSYPGFYVTGNLYRPKGRTGPFPVVLSPHGHWNNGRLYDAGEKEAAKQIAGEWEKDPIAAQYPLQARCANLAKLGCIVFFYDMVGYADADPEHFPHRKTYLDIDSDQRLISVFGLQTWDSLRAMDFVLSLPDADPSRTACTGASGGASQTLMMMVIDDRLKFAAPVCMFSADEHQGGCVCENNSLLRVGTDNIELAATFAPKPFVHPSATGDWTKGFMEHGFPEIRATYKLFDAETDVEAVRFEANHNYNLKSRETVYRFLNTKLKLGNPEPIVEHHFEAVLPKELAVFDAAHPRPADAVDAPTLKKYLINTAAKQLDQFQPVIDTNNGESRAFMVETLQHLLFIKPTAMNMVEVRGVGGQETSWGRLDRIILADEANGVRLPTLLLSPTHMQARGVTVLVTGSGKAGALNADGAPGPLAAALLAEGQAVLTPDVFLTGELAAVGPAATVAGKPVEFRAGYNRTTIGNRVQDILTTVAGARAVAESKPVRFVGIGRAGPWCLLARPLLGKTITRMAADADRFSFDSITSTEDENYLPGSMRYGGLWPMAAHGSSSGGFMVYNTGSVTPHVWLKAMISSDGFRFEAEAVDAKTVAAWITK